MVQRVITSGTTSDNEWQRVTTNDNVWQRVVQRVTMSGKLSDYEWQWVTMSDNEWQRVTKNDNEWQRVIKRMKMNKRVSIVEWFYVSNSNKRPTCFLDNFIQFFMQYVTTIRSSCSRMFYEIGVLKNFAMFTGKHINWSQF